MKRNFKFKFKLKEMLGDAVAIAAIIGIAWLAYVFGGAV